MAEGVDGWRFWSCDGVDLADMEVSKRLNQQDEQLIFIWENFGKLLETFSKLLETFGNFSKTLKNFCKTFGNF